MKKVTVFMPAYNAGLYIAEAITSILNQLYTNFSLLIINDGSTDDTEEVIKSFKDNRIHYIKNDTNIGVAAVANQALHYIDTEYIMRMDADDIAHPERLMKQLVFLENNPTYGLVGSWYHRITKTGTFIDVIEKETTDEDIRLNMLIRNQFGQPTVMMRTHLMKLLKYDESFKICEDYDLWERFMHVTKVANIPECLLRYRWHDTNTSIHQQQHLKEAVLNIIARQLDNFGISYTAEELFIHATLTFFHAHAYFHTTARLDALSSWLDKLSRSPQLIQKFGQEKVDSLIETTWQRIGLQTENRPTILRFHPEFPASLLIGDDASVIKSMWVGTVLSIINLMSIQSYLKLGHKFHLYTYHEIINLPEGVTIKDANTIIPEEYIFKENGSFSPFSDIFRYHLLYKLGGWWVDLDTICLKRLDDLNSEYVFPCEFHPDYTIGISNCVMKVPLRSKFLRDCLNFIAQRNITNIISTEIGPSLVGRMVYKNNLKEFVYPPSLFCPVPYYCHDIIINEVPLEIHTESYVLHCFTDLLRRKDIHLEKPFPQLSLMGRLQKSILSTA